MSTYLFFPSADSAQDDIWYYSCDVWGERQAEKYIRGLHCHLQLLADKKLFWRPLPANLVVPPDLTLDVYFSHYEHHYLFFRELSAGLIGIIAILHERADMPVRLCEDLRQIVENNE